jgi:hypothetical protein
VVPSQPKEFDVAPVPPPPTAVTWQKSSASDESGCVEVASSPEYVWVRDSKNRDAAVLGFTRKEWRAFLIGVRRGELDGPTILT